MFPRVNDVHHVDGYQLDLRFSDGTSAILDFHSRIAGRGGIFEPLQDVEYFARVAVDREAGTIAWPNSVDFCPDVLYASITGSDIGTMSNELDVA